MTQTAKAGATAGKMQINPPYRDFWRRFKKNRTALAGLLFLAVLAMVAILAPYIAPYDPYLGEITLALKGPGAAHLLGTDELGRDILSRIIFGARMSLAIGLLAMVTGFTIGTVLGVVAAYYRGWLDHLLMLFIDIMQSFPSLLPAIVIMAALGRGIENVIIAIGIVAVPEYARIARDAVLSIKENDYVQAARAVGNRDSGIIFRHILPNIAAPTIIRAAPGISRAILKTAALGFLGLGVQSPYAEWGAMLEGGASSLFNAPHIVYFPGMAITATVLAFNLLGDGLRDALDPVLHQVQRGVGK